VSSECRSCNYQIDRMYEQIKHALCRGIGGLNRSDLVRAVCYSDYPDEPARTHFNEAFRRLLEAGEIRLIKDDNLSRWCLVSHRTQQLQEEIELLQARIAENKHASYQAQRQIKDCARSSQQARREIAGLKAKIAELDADE
jgi:hypothetical protein